MLIKGNIIYVVISKFMIIDIYYSSSVCFLMFIFFSKFERLIVFVECKIDFVYEILV